VHRANCRVLGMEPIAAQINVFQAIGNFAAQAGFDSCLDALLKIDGYIDVQIRYIGKRLGHMLPRAVGFAFWQSVPCKQKCPESQDTFPEITLFVVPMPTPL